MLYSIIQDQTRFENFVSWLPELEPHEAFYVTLLARKKYHESATSDKLALKRFVATSKDWLVRKVMQLEIPQNRYTTKTGDPLHQDGLALYISPNPRNLKTAQKTLLKKLVDVALDQSNIQNPNALALSEIQKAKSRTCFIDFDFDIDASEVDPTVTKILDVIGPNAVRFLRTRGGLHALVDPKIAAQSGPKKWHKEISDLPGCDVVGDSLLPVPGCFQGGFIPHFMDV